MGSLQATKSLSKEAPEKEEEEPHVPLLAASNQEIISNSKNQQGQMKATGSGCDAPATGADAGSTRVPSDSQQHEREAEDQQKPKRKRRKSRFYLNIRKRKGKPYKPKQVYAKPCLASQVLKTKKERELYMLAYKACSQALDCFPPSPSDKTYKESRRNCAKRYREEMRDFVKSYDKQYQGVSDEERTRRSAVFLDETLYLACDILGIRFEIGAAWDNIDMIREELKD